MKGTGRRKEAQDEAEVTGSFQLSSLTYLVSKRRTPNFCPRKDGATLNPNAEIYLSTS